MRRVKVDARDETKSPVPRRYADATQTSFQVKKLVKVRSGAIRSSITYFKEESRPTENPQPIIAEKTPSRINGSWIEKELAPTNFITFVSRLLLKAAILKVLLINIAAVSTLANPIANAPSRKTFSNLKNFSRIDL